MKKFKKIMKYVVNGINFVNAIIIVYGIFLMVKK